MLKRRKKFKKNEKFKKRLLEIILLISIILILFYSIQNMQHSEVLPNYTVRIISPLNKTYNISKIPVTVLSDQNMLWIKNSVDDGPEITECEKCKYFSRFDWDFESGTHTLTVVASDFENMIIKANVTFTIK